MRIPWPVQRAVMRIAMRWYYREVEVEGLGRIPALGAVILAANHNNALVDALVVGAQVPRELRLTAKATLLENPLTRVIVHATGLVPLRRAKDEAARGAPAAAGRNEGAFDAIVRTLSEGGMILIFPEGISHSEPNLAPLRTGCARMALQALTAGVPEVTVVPIGITFENKGRPRSRVLLSVGEPIAATSVVGEPEAARLLTDRLAAGLRDVTLNFPSHDAAERVLAVSRTLGRLLDTTRPLEDGDVPLQETVRVARAVEQVRRALPQATPQDLTAIDSFIAALDRWRQRVHAAGVAPGEVDMSVGWGSAIRFAIREGAIAVIGAPVALWGRVHHLVPLRLALWTAQLTSSNPDEPAMHTLVVGFVLVLGLYAALAALVGGAFGWWWALAYLISLPMAASLDFVLTDRWRALVRRMRGFVALRRRPEERAILLEERARLRAEAATIAQRLGVAAE